MPETDHLFERVNERFNQHDKEDAAIHALLRELIEAEGNARKSLERAFNDARVSMDRSYNDKFSASEAAVRHALAAQINILTERDRRYESMFESAERARHAMRDEWEANSHAQEKAVTAALAAAERAVIKAETAAEKRFDSVNEFRQTLADQQATLMPRSEANVLFKSLSDKIDVLTQHDDLRKGKGDGVSASWGVLLGGLGLVVAIILAVFSGIGNSKQPQVVYVPAQSQVAPPTSTTTVVTKP